MPHEPDPHDQGVTGAVALARALGGTFDGLAHSGETSIAQEVTTVAPAGVTVVKAFNTIFRGVLEKGRPDVFLAGNGVGHGDFALGVAEVTGRG